MSGSGDRRPARIVLATLAALALLAAVAGVAVVGGLYNVSARAGHLPVVGWLMHTTYRNSVRLRAPPASEVPDLADPAMIRLGALHYEGACRTCHAAPGVPRTATALAMEPAPPHIAEAVRDWQPRHLHWIVREGVRMTGMPAWPADRPDEVWPVVAYLASVDGLAAEDHAALVRAPAVADPAIAYCAGCHGDDGVGDLAPHVPRLDIQGEAYLAAALAAYRDGARASGFMQHAATAVPPEALEAAARHYAALAPGRAGPPQDPDDVARGEALAAAVTADDDVPACRACHGPDPTARAEGTPSLAGQHRPYLERQLHLWRDGERGGGPRANLMHVVATDLDDGDIAALAAYYASLDPAK